MVTETFTAGEDFTVPDGVFSIEVELEGEAGEDGSQPGGEAARVAGDIEVRPGETLFIRDTTGGSGVNGAGDGGDAIDIRRGGTALSDRIAVGAGAGGGGDKNADGAATAGGDGGADTGESAPDALGADGGNGGTQSSGGLGGSSTEDGQDGVFGAGGDGGDSSGNGGGGGAGWYGGGGGGGEDAAGVNDDGAGGGGGSNYDDGLRNVTANERGTSTRTNGQGGLVTITYEQTPGAENLSITDTTATSNTLAWDAPTLPPEVDSVDQYRIYRGTDPGTERADYTQIATTPTPGFEDVGLENGTEYHYRVGADLFVPEADYQVTITGFREV